MAASPSTASPRELFGALLANLAPASSASASAAEDRLCEWDALHPTIVALYSFNAAHLRGQLAELDFDQTWGRLLPAALAIVPMATQLFDQTPRREATKEKGASGDDGSDDDTPDPHTRTRFQLGSVSRIAILLKNLCPGDARIQQRVQEILLASPATAVASLAMAYQAQLVEETTMDFKAPLRNLLLLYVNALTPGASRPTTTTSADERAWDWVREEMFPRALAPVLQMAEQHDLTSIATAIIHHAVLCRQANTGYQKDLNEKTQLAVEELARSDMLYALIRPGVAAVEAQLRVLNEDSDTEGEHAALSTNPPLEVWDWKPTSSEPPWLLHLLDLSFRCCPGFLTALSAKCDAREWSLVLRGLEVAVEEFDDNQDRASEIDKRQATPTKTSNDGQAQPQPPPGGLQHTALSVAVNCVQLLEWLQRREKQPLPIAAASTAQPAAADGSTPSTASSSPSSLAASPSSVPTSSIPIDFATCSILSTIGQVLLFRTWDLTVVFSSVRESLFTSTTLSLPAFLLSLLTAADALDGGAMFSELYRPLPGHTRHTKPSQVKEDYVNQFTTGEQKEQMTTDGAGSSDEAAAASPAVAAAASSRPPQPAFAGSRFAPGDLPRLTPYQFKSHLLRLLASLAFQHPGFQSSLGGSAIYACMNHSVLDSHNPLMREYAVLALRNLLEEHQDNQRIVAELRAEGIANQQELKEMGVETRMDDETGKISVTTTTKMPTGKESNL